MTKIAIFHLEASLEIGTGHAMRCLVLADKLKRAGFACHFATSQKSYDLVTHLQPFSRLDPQALWQNPINCDLMIFDNYDLDENHEKHFRNFAKKILVIDDLANKKHDCDILLDQNFGSQVDDYKNLVNNECKILAGALYSLLRQEFENLREAALKKRTQTAKIKKILVNFGGSDLKNHTLKALEEIEKSEFVGEIDAVLGFKAVHLEEIKKFAAASKNKINIHKSANMAQLIFDADIAVAAGGTSTWERCCLGLPTFMVKIADNQEKIFSHLGFAGNFAEFYEKCEKNYQNFVTQISKITDGKGASRVLSYLD